MVSERLLSNDVSNQCGPFHGPYGKAGQLAKMAILTAFRLAGPEGIDPPTRGSGGPSTEVFAERLKHRHSGYTWERRDYRTGLGGNAERQ